MRQPSLRSFAQPLRRISAESRGLSPCGGQQVETSAPALRAPMIIPEEAKVAGRFGERPDARRAAPKARRSAA